MLPPDPGTPGGLGLLLVEKLCETWGVWQDLGPTYVCLVRAPARSIPALGSDHAGGTRTYAQGCSRVMRSPFVTAVEAFMLGPAGRGPAFRSAIAVADPVPG
jgi:hypothetical protein